MAAQADQSIRPEIDRIIQAGQKTAVAAGSAKPVFALAFVTGLLLWVSFTPFEFAPAAWVALVPVCLLLRVRLLPKFSYRLIWLAAFVWALATLQWMRLGHWTMYGALLALSFYVAFYLPAFVVISRTTVRAGVPVWLTVPVVWTSLEFLRAYLFTGFSWYYLGHSQYRWTSLVQISDVTGAYGVTFLVATVAGCLTDFVPNRIFLRLKLVQSEFDILNLTRHRRTTSAVVSIGLVIMTCGYGMMRVSPADSSEDGPVVAVVQGNFTPELKHDPDKWRKMVSDHDLLTRRAASLQPHLIVWPETMFPVPDQIVAEGVTDDDLISILPMQGKATNKRYADEEIARWHSQYARELLTNRSQEAGAALMIGLLTEVAARDSRKRFNSAAFIDPDLGYVGRYDKAHRVIFGEYIPLRSVFPWLAKMTPFSAGFGIDAGTEPATFNYKGTTYSPIICFEDTVPQLVRRTVFAEQNGTKSTDVLINMTNDGWFRGSSELDQHLIAATFRCIETRRPMVRAVNAGISAFIDSSGRIRQPEHFWVMDEETAGVIGDFKKVDSMIDPETGRRYRQCSAVMCGQVPLDGRNTLYLLLGDWFAGLCSLVTVVAFAVGFRKRKTTDSTPNVAESKHPTTVASAA